MSENSGCISCRAIVVVFLFLFGVASLLAGIILIKGDVFPKMIRNQVDKNVMLKPGTLVYKNWLKPTSPIYLQFFVFHLKNPNEFFQGLEKPVVRQRGPYSYKEIRTNEVLSWNNDLSEVTFMPNRTYIFDPETSCKNCNDTKDEFTTVNIPLMSLITFMENKLNIYGSGFCHEVINGLIDATQPSLFQNISVYEMIWGYTDPLLKIIYDYRNDSSLKACPLPEGFTPFVQLQKNNTYYGISAVNTGQENIDLLEQYTMWRNKRELSWWSDSYANMINGTDGSQTKPHLSKHDVIRVFSPQICRSIYAVYKTTKQVRGIELYRYAAPDEMYLSGDLYPANKGFCVPPGCLPTGLLNISLCQPMNPPVVISPPHFYQCNKSLLDAIDGLHPDKDLHGTHMDIEPITGITMNARKRLQVNIAMHPSTLIKPTDGKFNPVFLPALFIEEKAEIDEHDASKFKETVYIPILLTKVVEWGLVALGVTLIIIAIVLLVCRPRKNSYAPVQMEEEKTPLLGEEK